MKPRQIIITSIIVGVLVIITVILLTSPLTPQLLNADSPKSLIDAVVGLFLGVAMLAGASALSITFIIACCYLAKRLGYEMSFGLLLLIPVVNLVVFFR
jgi:hypothetical protein